MEKRECRKCLLLMSGEEDNYRLVKQHVEKIRLEDKAPDELYMNRLEYCKECEQLISGTCLKCGCYVEFRAAFLNKKCPMKKW